MKIFSKKVSFDDFFMVTWEREKESERKKEPQIPRLNHFLIMKFQVKWYENTNSKIYQSGFTSYVYMEESLLVKFVWSSSLYTSFM